MEIIGIDKQITPPERLYKYFGNHDYAYRALSGKLHLDNPKDYNDPFEYVEEDSLLDGFPNEKTSLKMACFAEVKDSILMWGYYANSHKGVCLEYSIRELKDTTTKILDHTHHEKNLYYGIRPIHYTPLRWKDTDDIFDKTYKKADVWHHELEWRFVARTDETEIKFDFVTAVYFGVKTDFTQKSVQKIMRSCSIRHIPMYRMKMHLNEYQLVEELIPPLP